MPLVKVAKVPPTWDAIRYDPANKQELCDWLGIDIGSTEPIHISDEGVVYPVDDVHEENGIQTYGWNVKLSIKDGGYVIRGDRGYEVYPLESFSLKYREV